MPWSLIAIVLSFQIESKKREAEAEKERQRLYDEKMMKKIEEDNKRIQQELEEEKRKAVEKQAKVEILMTFSIWFFIMWFPSHARRSEDSVDFHPPLHTGLAKACFYSKVQAAGFTGYTSFCYHAMIIQSLFSHCLFAY